MSALEEELEVLREENQRLRDKLDIVVKKIAHLDEFRRRWARQSDAFHEMRKTIYPFAKMANDSVLRRVAREGRELHLIDSDHNPSWPRATDPHGLWTWMPMPVEWFDACARVYVQTEPEPVERPNRLIAVSGGAK